MIGDAGEHIGEPSLWVDIVELCGLDQRVKHGSALATAVGAAEQPGFAAKWHRRVILPMSGSWWSFIIAGIRFTAGDFGMKVARIGPVARLSG